MIALRFSPAWFSGYDIFFEALAVVVTLFIGIYSYKLYNFSGNHRHKYLSWSFWALSISFLAKIATNFIIYYETPVKTMVGETLIRYNLIQQSHVLFYLGYDTHRFLMSIGLLGIYWLVSKKNNSDTWWMITFLLFIITVFSSQMYYVFHITAAMILLFITKEYRCLCFKKKKKATLHAHLNFFAFLTILLSQVVFIFIWVDLVLYVAAQGLQLIGFALFLANMILLVFGHGKTKNKD